MGLMSFLKRLFGGGPPKVPENYRPPSMPAPAGASSQPTRKRTWSVGVMSADREFLVRMRTLLRTLTDGDRFQYVENPRLQGALKCSVLVMDVRPEVDARMHSSYDQVLRIKKGQGKGDDMLCVVGPRAKYVEYPRGTYPKLLYVVVENDNFEHAEPDLPEEGQGTMEGPTLLNLASLPGLVKKRLEDLYYGGR